MRWCPRRARPARRPDKHEDVFDSPETTHCTLSIRAKRCETATRYLGVLRYQNPMSHYRLTQTLADLPRVRLRSCPPSRRSPTRTPLEDRPYPQTLPSVLGNSFAARKTMSRMLARRLKVSSMVCLQTLDGPSSQAPQETLSKPCPTGMLIMPIIRKLLAVKKRSVTMITCGA